jgi:hypothetical protein
VPDLEERVAALEAALAPAALMTSGESWTDEQVAEFGRLFDETMQQEPHSHRVLCQPPPLTPEQVRYLLRECVTVVGPGETLVIRGRDWTPMQVREVQDWMDSEYGSGRISFRVLAVIGDELGVVHLAEGSAGG